MTARRRHPEVSEEERARTREIVETMGEIEEAHGGVMPRRGLRSEVGFARTVGGHVEQDDHREPDDLLDDEA